MRGSRLKDTRNNRNKPLYLTTLSYFHKATKQQIMRSSSMKTDHTDADGSLKRMRGTLFRHCLAVFCVSSFALLVGAVVFCVLTTTKKKQRKGETQYGREIDMEVEKQKWKDLRDLVLAEFSPVDEQFAIDIHNPLSAEWKALQWLSLSDEYESSSQRYVMALIWTFFGIDMEPLLHECQWHGGVQCRNNVVIGLNFTGLPAFHTTLPRSLAYLPSLEILDLSRQGIEGFIPTICYKHWNKLQVLNLEENYLTSIFGGVNDDSWPAIRYLNAKNNRLAETVPEEISKMTSLSNLLLKGNEGLTGPVRRHSRYYMKFKTMS